MFRSAAVALLAGSASAFMGGNVNLDSAPLRKLLKSATLVEGRGLGNNNQNNNNQNGMQNVISNLYLKYAGCANAYTIAGGQGGGGGGQNNKNGQNGGYYNSPIANWELREGCDGKLVGKYASNMNLFIDTFMESTLDELEWLCENYYEEVCEDLCANNNNGQGSRQQCSYQCFMDAYNTTGKDLSACAKDYSEDYNQDFEVQRYLYCDNVKNENNKNGNNNGQNNAYQYSSSTDFAVCYAADPYWDGVLRTGPFCDTDGYSIKLGMFCDYRCSVKAPSGVYEELNNGNALPYSTTSLIPKHSCLACVTAETQHYYEQQNQNNGGNNANANNWNNMQPSDFCTLTYQSSIKCEEADSEYTADLTYGPTTSGCAFIEEYLPKLYAAQTGSSTTVVARSGKNAAKPLAIIFAITTVVLGSYAYFLYTKTKRGAVGLSTREGGMA